MKGVSFLGTDKVPPTIFGIPVVTKDYLPKDIEFFKRYPTAGGYYDLGEEDTGTSGAVKGGDTITGKLRRRIGDAGSVVDAGLAWIERQHKQAIDMDIPVVSKVTEAVLQPAVLGARVAVANATSGGGKYYQPEVRDERYFSNNALKELGSSIAAAKGRTGVRADGMDNAAQFNLTQTLGGFTVANGKVTDKFDINPSYTGVPQPLTNVARAILGKEEDPDRGKVRTEIPLSKIPGTHGSVKGGDTKKFYGLRNDGKTWKGSGWLGELPLKGGGTATEYSVGVNIAGKDMDIPSLVPTLTRDEISQMTNDLIPNGKPLPESIVRKAAEHAKARIAEGKSVWANDGLSIYEKAISDAIPFVKKHEGFSKTAYRKKLGTDKAGKPVWDKWTIGYGQTEIDGRPVRQGDVIDEKTASKFVEDRIRSQAADLYRDQKWSRNFRNPGTLSAMYDIMYNAGPAIFNEKNSPKLNEAMKTLKGDYDRYMWKEQIPTYRNKANGVEMRGLRNRNNDMTKAFGPRSSVV